MKKQHPRKRMEKVLRRREKRKRNMLPEKKKPCQADVLYDKTKKLAKNLGVRFLKDNETWRDYKYEAR